MKEILKTLKNTFGHDDFRHGQREMVQTLLSGKDAFGIMPTGAGKSICYQLPALMMDGITIVISPLISLMKDQVMALKSMGVPAAYLNSSLTAWQQNEAIRRATLNTYRIIYVAPERLEVPSFLNFATNAKLAMIAVDEAHCVSQWGQDFRPSYLHIANFIDKLPKRPVVGAFTATATKKVQEDVVSLLKLQSPLRITTGYDRPNLYFSCYKPTDKKAYLVDFVSQRASQSGIIYCQTRKAVEEVCFMLKSMNFPVTRYHAGLDDNERMQNQEDFRFDRAKIMVATNAFGMGIDKSNVRYVVHYNMPKDLESYYQEAGRAGRDGADSICVLLYHSRDYFTAKWMIENSEDHPDFTKEQQDKRIAHDLERLRQMMNYTNSTTCLRNAILRYFGEYNTKPCMACSVCNKESLVIDTGVPYTIPNKATRKTRREEKRLSASSHTPLHDKTIRWTAWEKAQFNNLKELRYLLSQNLRLPAYLIFSDSTLQNMINRRPKNLQEFLEVSGVGEAKQKRFGPVFLAVLKDGKEPNEAIFEFFEG